jgi:hypothetical protein
VIVCYSIATESPIQSTNRVSNVLVALQAIYPDYVPEDKSKPAGYWKVIENQRAFFDQLAIKLNIQNPDDWCKVTLEKAVKEGGRFITRYYNSSMRLGSDILVIFLTICEALQTVYPELATANWRAKPHGYWRDKENQRAFFDRLAVKWNIQKPEDWNKMSTKMVMSEGGNFISYYNHSVSKGIYTLNTLSHVLALQAVYPEFTPAEWKSKPRGYWKDKENQKAFFEQLASKLNIQKPEDWHLVTKQTIKDEGGSFVDKYYNYSLVKGKTYSLLLTNS